MDWQQQVSKQEEQQRKKNKPTTSFTNDESLQRKVETVCNGLLPNVAALFMELSDTNKKAIAEFILDLVHRKNIAVNTKGIHLKNLVYLIRFWKGMVELQDMKQDHVDGYLQSMRRDKETDPDQRWIATHNTAIGTGTGDDKLSGGKGDDIMGGQGGADKFNCGKGQDTVTDFNEAEGDKASGNCEGVD